MLLPSRFALTQPQFRSQAAGMESTNVVVDESVLATLSGCNAFMPSMQAQSLDDLNFSVFPPPDQGLSWPDSAISWIEWPQAPSLSDNRTLPVEVSSHSSSGPTIASTVTHTEANAVKLGHSERSLEEPRSKHVSCQLYRRRHSSYLRRGSCSCSARSAIQDEIEPRWWRKENTDIPSTSNLQHYHR